MEYLGEDYPLYFDNLEEVSNLLSIENITKAHNYMKQLNKDYLNVEYFKKQFMNIMNQELFVTK